VSTTTGPRCGRTPAASQQLHLDIGVQDLDRAHAQVVDLGAEPIDDGGGTRSWRIYTDPAGHPF
jgi:hypothetical protein